MAGTSWRSRQSAASMSSVTSAASANRRISDRRVPAVASETSASVDPGSFKRSTLRTRPKEAWLKEARWLSRSRSANSKDGTPVRSPRRHSISTVSLRVDRRPGGACRGRLQRRLGQAWRRCECRIHVGAMRKLCRWGTPESGHFFAITEMRLQNRHPDPNLVLQNWSRTLEDCMIKRSRLHACVFAAAVFCSDVARAATMHSAS